MLEDAFLRAILDAPDDDAPRLVYADWLDDHGGGERAELIRAQVERLRLPPGDGREDELRRREGRLLFKQLQEWRARLGSGKADLVLRRGFVEGMALAATSWQRLARKVTAATPLRRLRLYDAGPRLAALCRSPHLAGLTHLDLGGDGVDDEGARLLAACPHLAGLTHLLLPRNGLTASGAQALALSPHLANLAVLDLSANTVGDEGARVLAQSPHLRNLKELFLGSNDVHDEGAQALAASPNLAGLRELMLVVNQVGDRGARALTGSKHLARLEKLYLSQNPLTPATAKKLQKAWGARLVWLPSRPGR